PGPALGTRHSGTARERLQERLGPDQRRRLLRTRTRRSVDPGEDLRPLAPAPPPRWGRILRQLSPALAVSDLRRDGPPVGVSPDQARCRASLAEVGARSDFGERWSSSACPRLQHPTSESSGALTGPGTAPERNTETCSTASQADGSHTRQPHNTKTKVARRHILHTP